MDLDILQQHILEKDNMFIEPDTRVSDPFHIILGQDRGVVVKDIERPPIG